MEASPEMLAAQSYCDGGLIDDRPLCLHSQLASPWSLDFCCVPTWFGQHGVLGVVRLRSSLNGGSSCEPWCKN